jgi:hypothetical protein
MRTFTIKFIKNNCINEHAADMQGLLVRKVVGATKQENEIQSYNLIRPALWLLSRSQTT